MKRLALPFNARFRWVVEDDNLHKALHRLVCPFINAYGPVTTTTTTSPPTPPTSTGGLAFATIATQSGSPGVISVNVLFNGAGIAGVSVVFYINAKNVGTALTDATGHAQLSVILPAGSTVYATASYGTATAISSSIVSI